MDDMNLFSTNEYTASSGSTVTSTTSYGGVELKYVENATFPMVYLKRKKGPRYTKPKRR